MKHTSARESLSPFPSARQYQLQHASRCQWVHYRSASLFRLLVCTKPLVQVCAIFLLVSEFKSVHINRYLLNRIPIVSFGRTCCLLTILSHCPAGLGIWFLI
ncbi:hypothetical protein Ahy_B05g074993 isoform C [Arachis hypogaea]|uniref:Uncharacterized protein n=1 Tax=Arachis hypogaea TaxID=3818 RepID=A0A444Z081_ARAHY|nr:hypothetical protein Ahy_B05g074993 isoform C [Arachis hypogaea]